MTTASTPHVPVDTSDCCAITEPAPTEWEATDIRGLASRLAAASGRERSRADAELALALWRRLVQSRDGIQPEELRSIAEATGTRGYDLATILRRSAEVDPDGTVRGFGGLSLNIHPDTIEFDGRTVHAWCAWDPFFLVPALGGTGRLRSTDSHSGAPVEVAFEAGRVASADPGDAVLSIVIPAPGACSVDGHEAQCGRSTVEETWSSFCSHVHLFANRYSAEAYFANRGDEIELLSADQALELARLRYADVLDLAQ